MSPEFPVRREEGSSRRFIAGERASEGTPLLPKPARDVATRVNTIAQDYLNSGLRLVSSKTYTVPKRDSDRPEDPLVCAAEQFRKETGNRGINDPTVRATLIETTAEGTVVRVDLLAKTTFSYKKPPSTGS